MADAVLRSPLKAKTRDVPGFDFADDSEHCASSCLWGLRPPSQYLIAPRLNQNVLKNLACVIARASTL